jgi:hypothetical protein
MPRLVAIALLCVFVCSPSFASEAEPAGQVEPTAPSTAAQQLTALPPEILEKLDPDSIAEILLARETGGYFGGEGEGPGVPAVAIVIPLAFFLTILLVVISPLILRYRRHAQVHETLRLMIEKGAKIPPELLAPPVAEYGDLRRGLILIGAGSSLSIAIGLINGFESGSWAVGIIPAFIGAGYLIVWRYSQRAESA